MPGNRHTQLCCLEGSTPQDGVYLCLSPCDGCKNPGGVMVGLAENIQACLRIFRRTQHQWLVRDILHQPQGVFYVFVLWHRYGFKWFKMFKWFKGFKGFKWFKGFKRFKMFKRFKGFNSVLSVLEKRKGELLDGDVGKERLNESAGMRDFLL